MLFRKKIEPRCSYCARGGRANDHEVICAKKGIVPAESHCGAFRYDPGRCRLARRSWRRRSCGRRISNYKRKPGGDASGLSA